MKREIKLIISDFDGTLVDTREANFLAYRNVLKEVGYVLTEKKYAKCFGLRFEEFMERLAIHDPAVRKKIQILKMQVYPDYFSLVKVNQGLAKFIDNFRKGGGLTAIATTARHRNLINVLTSIGLKDLFDFIIAGEDINRPKPDPECYMKAMSHFQMTPYECLIFEDSTIGIQAASASGANYIVVKEFFYGN